MNCNACGEWFSSTDANAVLCPTCERARKRLGRYVVDRSALLGKVTEVAIRKWNGSHFTTQIIRVIPEEALLAAPVVIHKETE